MKSGLQPLMASLVALRKESVDRNTEVHKMDANTVIVALRKESVDRNQKKAVAHKAFDASLSARRAWIEIFISREISLIRPCRSPQGERG